MRINLLDLRKLHLIWGNQVVYNSYASFRNDRQFEVLQVVVILMHGPGQSILDRHDRPRRPTLFQAAEYVFKAFTRQYFYFRFYELPRGFFTKSAASSLERDQFPFHFGPSHLRTLVSG